MAKNANGTKKQTGRTETKELPQRERELTKDEQKQIKGGMYCEDIPLARKT